MAVTVIRLGEGVAESAALLRAASIAATISAAASIPISPIGSGFGFGLNERVKLFVCGARFIGICRSGRGRPRPFG